MKRPLTAEDLGIKGTVLGVEGTVEVEGDRMTVSIDLIRAEIKNVRGLVPNLETLARSYGVTKLRIEGDVVNDKLRWFLRIYGLKRGEFGDYIEIDLS
jgi:hypothetical protein